MSTEPPAPAPGPHLPPSAGADSPFPPRPIVPPGTEEIAADPPAEPDLTPDPEAASEVAPVSLLAPGSQDDSFLQSPFSHRLGPDLPDSASDLVAAPRSGTADALAGLGVSTAPAPAHPAASNAAPPPSSSDDDVDTHPDAARPSWPMVLLGSYASAVTLALGWVLIHPPGREAAVEPFVPAAPIVAEAPEAAPRGHRVAPLAPLPADRMAQFQKPLRVGSLEITPLEARRQDVTLRRVGVSGEAAERKGQPGTIVLRVRLHNPTADLAFAPLDPAFVRARGTDVLDCFAETSAGERIYLYPLALESELGLVGQDFKELRPGETRTVVIATAPDAPRVAPESLTWRLRFRTGLEQVEAIGVSPAGK